MKTAKELLERAGTLLLDQEFTRWTLDELCTWINDGQLEIVIQKPSATARTVNLPMVEGTLQSLPTGYNSILRPVRNVRGDHSDRLPRKVITVAAAEGINSITPGWHDPYSVPFKQQVAHFIFDEANPRQFYVYPGNNGTGIIEAVLSENPKNIEPKGDPLELESYDVPLGIEDIYFPALTYFVMYRAFAKDTQYAGSAQRATMFYQQFANALGIQVTVETNMSPNVKPGVGGAAVGVTQ